MYISVITKSSAKGDISGEEIFIIGWMAHHFIPKYFVLYHLKRFRGTKRLCLAYRTLFQNRCVLAI